MRWLKTLFRRTWLRLALDQPLLVIALAGMLLIAALLLYPMMGKEFLPTFNEGSATISLVSAPGTSLSQTNEIGEAGVRLLQTIPEVKSVGRRVAVVICGGLVTSTLLGLGVTPAVFHAFGRKAAEKAIRRAAPASR